MLGVQYQIQSASFKNISCVKTNEPQRVKNSDKKMRTQKQCDHPIISIETPLYLNNIKELKSVFQLCYHASIWLWCLHNTYPGTMWKVK